MTKKCDRCSTSQQHRIAQENPWWIHVDVWQNQYNIVKLKKKKELHRKSELSVFILSDWQR